MDQLLEISGIVLLTFAGHIEGGYSDLHENISDGSQVKTRPKPRWTHQRLGFFSFRDYFNSKIIQSPTLTSNSNYISQVSSTGVVLSKRLENVNIYRIQAQHKGKYNSYQLKFVRLDVPLVQNSVQQRDCQVESLLRELQIMLHLVQ